MSEPLLPRTSDEPDVPDAHRADLTVDATDPDVEGTEASDGDAPRPSRLPRPEAGERLTADELQQELHAD